MSEPRASPPLEPDALRQRGRRSLALALGVTFVFMVVELVGALLTNSLALLADAFHMLEHVASQSLALGAFWLASRPATPQRSYGYHRAEILAALLNSFTMLLLIAYILFEASQRLQDTPEVRSLPMLVVASLGLGANAAVLLILRRTAQTSLNIKGVFLHSFGDLAGSLAAVTAGFLMLTLGWFLADPVFSMVSAAVILFAAVRLLWQTLPILLEGTPPGLDLQQLGTTIASFREVQSVHDLHA